MGDDTLFCLRVRFVQTGRLRYLSHLELIRALERIVRRAGLPYAITQGYSPRMKIAYCPALPVGVGSFDEWFDVWLSAYVPSEEALNALACAAPPDLMPCEVAYTEVHGTSLSCVLTISVWQCTMESTQADQGAYTFEDILRAYNKIVQAGEITYQKGNKTKRILLADKIAAAPTPITMDGVRKAIAFTFATRSSNEGALRPDVFINEICSRLENNLPACGSVEDKPLSEGVLSRTRTRIDRIHQYLEDKDGSWRRPI